MTQQNTWVDKCRLHALQELIEESTSKAFEHATTRRSLRRQSSRLPVVAEKLREAYVSLRAAQHNFDEATGDPPERLTRLQAATDLAEQASDALDDASQLLYRFGGSTLERTRIHQHLELDAIANVQLGVQAIKKEVNINAETATVGQRMGVLWRVYRDLLQATDARSRLMQTGARARLYTRWTSQFTSLNPNAALTVLSQIAVALVVQRRGGRAGGPAPIAASRSADLLGPISQPLAPHPNVCALGPSASRAAKGRSLAGPAAPMLGTMIVLGSLVQPTAAATLGEVTDHINGGLARVNLLVTATRGVNYLGFASMYDAVKAVDVAQNLYGIGRFIKDAASTGYDYLLHPAVSVVQHHTIGVQSERDLKRLGRDVDRRKQHAVVQGPYNRRWTWEPPTGPGCTGGVRPLATMASTLMSPGRVTSSNTAKPRVPCSGCKSKCSPVNPR